MMLFNFKKSFWQISKNRNRESKMLGSCSRALRFSYSISICKIENRIKAISNAGGRS